MNRSSDETTQTRVPMLENTTSPSDTLQLDWQVSLDDPAQDLIRLKVLNVSLSADLEGMPARAIVRRPSGPRVEEDVHVDIYDRLGTQLCSVAIGDNGFGKLRLLN